MALYIYLKKGNALNEAKVFHQENGEGFQWSYKGLTVYDIESTPLITYDQDISVINQIGLTNKLFLKATLRKKHRVMINPREFGVYVFGKAKAKLLATDKTGEYLLEIETNDVNGFNDMEILEEMILTGSISPVLSYSSVQKKQSLFEVLKYILSKRKLSMVQRFFFCLKLTALN